MSIYAVLQYGLFILLMTLLVRPVGGYLFRVFEGQKTLPDVVLRPVERLIYKVVGIQPEQQMDWRAYAAAFILFSLVGTIILFIILLAQPLLPWYNAAAITTPMTLDLALNTAISFATTTTWQAYGGESTMSYTTQMLGLTAQNFLAGAAGLAVGVAFIRGLARQNTRLLGNFWVDVTRGVLWVLLPVALIGGVLLVWQGVPMNFQPYTAATTVQGGSQLIAQGPVAALEIIKNLGTNGGGFFNGNGAHPYANPTPLTNFGGMLTIIIIPAALTNTFGRMVEQPRQGWLLYRVMLFFFVAGLVIMAWAEQTPNPTLTPLGVDATFNQAQSGGSMEGKETRFGVHGSVLGAVTTSNTATGSVSAMHASLTPIGAGVTLFNMLIGELVFGGLGTGIYSMVMMIIISLFIGGLMIGRTPEYLGKKVAVREIKAVAIYILMIPFGVLVLSALALVSEAGKAGIGGDYGPHGFTAIVYAYASSAANNGQNFANLAANTPFYNITTAIAMLIGRFGLALPALAVAGRLAQQTIRPQSAGSLPTASLVFAILLVTIIIVVGALSFFPGMALGPIVDHLLSGK